MLYQVITAAIKESLFINFASADEAYKAANNNKLGFIQVASDTGQKVILNKNTVIGFTEVLTVAASDEILDVNPHTGSALETALEDGNLDDNGLKLDGN